MIKPRGVGGAFWKTAKLAHAQYILMCFILLAMPGLEASPKKELNQLETRIFNIKKQLSQDENTREKLYKKLAETEKKISEDLHALHLLTPKEKQKQQEIQSMTKTIEDLNRQLKTQEKILATHLRARHKLGATHPWLWLLQQETPHTMSRLYVFYHYLFRADQKIIDQIRETRTQRLKHQVLLSHEQDNLNALQTKLILRQKRLSLFKQKQQMLIDTLDQHIQTKHEQLKMYHNDKARLQSLVTKLSQPRQTSALSALKLEGKYLNSPLNTLPKARKPFNQGMVFLANEGTPVVSVLPGKVVFSDWLKGYGLLLIIDHGHGIMSLYAHNASLFKRLGTSVEQGEQIATVGHTGGLRENGLYFEIRRRGKTIPTREWIS